MLRTALLRPLPGICNDASRSMVASDRCKAKVSTRSAARGHASIHDARKNSPLSPPANHFVKFAPEDIPYAKKRASWPSSARAAAWQCAHGCPLYRLFGRDEEVVWRPEHSPGRQRLARWFRTWELQRCGYQRLSMVRARSRLPSKTTVLLAVELIVPTQGLRATASPASRAWKSGLTSRSAAPRLPSKT